MDRLKINTINYMVVCINEFAGKFNLSIKEAYKYLENYGALRFLLENYEIEHTLGIEDAIEDLTTICNKNGGYLN
ncbi:DUF3791 domain-containing protein [Herbivorax sp. ANBcel31]|uniref:DUF3791 domain-containing protein n=1 Tax=Herbivorax sp. ANBcel31 TaxID=3069754 RepID=UPI0027B6C05E|nr:DUF3791 domain-containing protein [Herbivorax sp. ANBcel31]MDQ2086459.1 DUF3791 domain-containing protein [Herbivorax sp. ANBcel31]